MASTSSSLFRKSSPVTSSLFRDNKQQAATQLPTSLSVPTAIPKLTPQQPSVSVAAVTGGISAMNVSAPRPTMSPAVVTSSPALQTMHQQPPPVQQLPAQQLTTAAPPSAQMSAPPQPMVVNTQPPQQQAATPKISIESIVPTNIPIARPAIVYPNAPTSEIATFTSDELKDALPNKTGNYHAKLELGGSLGFDYIGPFEGGHIAFYEDFGVLCVPTMGVFRFYKKVRIFCNGVESDTVDPSMSTFYTLETGMYHFELA